MARSRLVELIGNIQPKDRLVRFDHNTPVSICTNENSKYLIQNGVRFSYAEFDRIAKKYVPEPVMITDDQFHEPELRDKIASLIRQMKELQKQLGENLALLEAASRKARTDGKEDAPGNKK